MSTEEILRGLKHYRRIAKQDVLRAAETPNPEAFRIHAESRREIYALLTECAEVKASEDVIERALELYQQLPFVSGTQEFEHPEIKGRENALENFFLMVGLDPKLRREARRKRPSLEETAQPAQP
ncbi:hypothetical protein HNR42_001361 [Deinobacterium chartae]|uniref:Uncharacterized protein n=2 Tax=Deinobacterium chartae TaxID=521158 RepID=A0A841I0Z1_9DEIO|nr:hypothetical protein [Deinobacterium chartae]